MEVVDVVVVFFFWCGRREGGGKVSKNLATSSRVLKDSGLCACGEVVDKVSMSRDRSSLPGVPADAGESAAT